MNNKVTQPLIVIAGPTGVGKTDLSIALAKQWQGEIINGDSLQVYQGLDIGTGKIKDVEMEGIPHYLLDILSVDQKFDVSSFKDLASYRVEDILGRGKLPFIVGGTGLYIEGLIYEMDLGHAHDPKLRQKLQERLDQEGSLKLWEELQRLDPKAAANIPYQNGRRIIRALEVIALTGRCFSEQEGQLKRTSRYDDCLIFLDRPRDQLYDRINARVLQMVSEGLEEEARQLYRASLGKNFQSIMGIGYKEWLPYFEGQASRTEVIEAIQQNSRRYAKRQLTWFRNRFEGSYWIDMSDMTEAIYQANQIIHTHLNP